MSIIRFIMKSDRFVFENHKNISCYFYRKHFDVKNVQMFTDKLEKFLAGDNQFAKDGEHLIKCENDDEPTASFVLGFADGKCFLEVDVRFPTMPYGDGNIHILETFDNQIMLHDLKTILLPKLSHS